MSPNHEQLDWVKLNRWNSTRLIFALFIATGLAGWIRLKQVSEYSGFHCVTNRPVYLSANQQPMIVDAVFIIPGPLFRDWRIQGVHVAPDNDVNSQETINLVKPFWLTVKGYEHPYQGDAAVMTSATDVRVSAYANNPGTIQGVTLFSLQGMQNCSGNQSQDMVIDFDRADYQ